MLSHSKTFMLVLIDRMRYKFSVSIYEQFRDNSDERDEVIFYCQYLKNHLSLVTMIRTGKKRKNR